MMNKYKYFALEVVLLCYIGFMACRVKKEVQRSKLLTDSIEVSHRKLLYRELGLMKESATGELAAGQRRRSAWTEIDSLTAAVEVLPGNTGKITYSIHGLRAVANSRERMRRSRSSGSREEKENRIALGVLKDSGAVYKEKAVMTKRVRRSLPALSIPGIITIAGILYWLYRRRNGRG
ncbi:hypothetical protein A9P82_05715 [Arachidicoccus ginsenosidimutans]|uniref:hypothetical protein n=1 Tax=Arachidicoccus sp. BS20 TaxID=1850526 RepID=UPI0007F09778|nr:hypothetical protein [Arachidicoccus sp. BS20]ANI88828.1 hypothetical protein A9P82_05715 [Arachidicoccus sp. BS20]